jgi:UDP-N-acetylglucosamine--dolichyl-phosphate N-acetylglucosaminephosphotransferase
VYRIIIAVIVSFLIVLLTLPTAIKLLREKGIVGIDVHKLNRPEIPKGAGYVLLFAIVTALLIVIGTSTFVFEGIINPNILAALVSILMAGMIGLLDDMLDFKNRTKVLLPLVASIPMMAMNVGTTTMEIPFIGTLNLGVLYPLLIVPLMTTFIIDSTNMYGGMNGLEVGMTSINASAIIAYILLLPIFDEGATPSQMDAATIAAALLGASIAFFIFNKFPAKVLLGDVGRLPLGAAIAAALILGNMDRLAIILYLPFGINFIMYLIYRYHVKKTGIEYQKFAKIRDDGTLEVVGPYTMYWLLPHFFKVTEKRNVQLLLVLQAIIAYGGTLFLLLVYPFGVGWF